MDAINALPPPHRGCGGNWPIPGAVKRRFTMACATSVADHPEPGEIANNQSHKGATPPRPVGVPAVEERPADHEQAEEQDSGADRPEQEVGDRLDPAALGF